MMLGTLTRKVVVLALIFFALSAATAAFAVANIVIIRTAVEHLNNDTVQQVSLSGHFNTDMFRGMAEVLFYARDRQPANRADALQEMHDAKEILDELADLEAKIDPYAVELGSERAQLQARRVAVYNSIQPNVLTVIQAVEAHDDGAAEQALIALNNRKAEVEQFEEDSSELADRSIAAAATEVHTRIQNALLSAGVSFGLFVLILLCVLLVLRRWVVQPISSLSLAASAVADGQIDSAVQVTNQDEIGRLQRTFNMMTQNLRMQRTALEQHSIDLARANSEAQAARVAAEQASQLKSEFLANMSHELRTPLNSIINFTRILAAGMRGPVNADQIDYLNRVRTSGEHLLGLINDVLDLSKIESGRMDLYIEQIQVGEMIHGVMATAAGLVKGKPITLREDSAPGLPLIEADRTRLRQILLNLLSNAAKFTEHGSITVRAWIENAQLIMSVVDTGIGIAPEHLDEVFEEFRQIDGATNRRYEGTGLGLPICRRLVELHGGRIWLESTPGVGSTFSFSLPIGRIPEVVERENVLEAAPASGGIPILVIDDDPAAIEIVSSYLSPDGYAVYGITDSRRAIEEARLIRPAAIILDVLMPYKDGWEVLTEFKEDPELHTVPVLLFSIVEERKLGFYLGASAYLLKPIDADELRRTVAQLVVGDATILVIDDDPNALEIVKQQLDQAGSYRVVTATGGQSGLDWISSESPDLIILDLMMPDVDGFTVLDTLEHMPNGCNIPVIVLTAKDLTAQEREFLHCRVSGLLMKGQTAPDQLLGKVRTLLHPSAQSTISSAIPRKVVGLDEPLFGAAIPNP